MTKKIDLGFDMAVQVHAHKSSKLQKPGIDAAQGARIAQRHNVDQVAPEPTDRPARRQTVDLGWVDPRIDRAGHQSHAVRLCRIGIFGQDRDRG
jgi:hypothetical protein